MHASNFEYRTDAGSRVQIPVLVNPYSILGIHQSSPHTMVKAAFHQKICTGDRQQRALVSLAYDMLGTLTKNNGREGVYSLHRDRLTVKITKADVFFLCITGNVKQLNRVVTKQRRLLQTEDAFGCTLLYLAARSGYYDVVSCLLGLLSDAKQLNAQMEKSSTALHAASFYGHAPVVSLLLEYGIFTDVMNTFGSTAESEAKDDGIRQVFKSMKEDKIACLAEKMMKMGFGHRVKVRKNLKAKGEIVAKEIERCKPSDMSDHAWRNIQSTWTAAWHGTKFKHVESIFQNGLLPSGSRLDTGEEIKPAEGHIKLGVSISGAKDWARAVFVSPTILYAGHVCYAERIQSSGATWCVLMKTKVEPEAFSAHGSTTPGYAPTEGEPDLPEYRIALDDRIGGKYIVRIEQSRNVVVTSAMFVQVNFLEHFEDYGISYSNLVDLLA